MFGEFQIMTIRVLSNVLASSMTSVHVSAIPEEFRELLELRAPTDQSPEM